MSWLTREPSNMEVCLTSDGELVWVEPPKMPRLEDLFLDSSVYIYRSETGARGGEGLGEGGSGFITTVQIGQTLFCYFATAAHLVRDRPTVVRISRRVGEPWTRKFEPGAWKCHDDADVAVLPAPRFLDPANMKIAQVPHVLYVKEDMVPDPDYTHYDPERDFGIGDECYFFGRFRTHEGLDQNLPTLRFGHLAKWPIEPVLTDEAGPQDVFLVECHSFPGYSGSPVFIYRSGRVNWKSEYVPMTEPRQIGFLGVDIFHLPHIATLGYINEKNEFELSKPPQGHKKAAIEQTSGMMGVVPAWKLTELLFDPKYPFAEKRDAEMRRQEVERLDALTRQKPVLESSEPGESNDEYERFEELARGLVQVPKEEIDEARKREGG